MVTDTPDLQGKKAAEATADAAAETIRQLTDELNVSRAERDAALALAAEYREALADVEPLLEGEYSAHTLTAEVIEILAQPFPSRASKLAHVLVAAKAWHADGGNYDVGSASHALLRALDDLELRFSKQSSIQHYEEAVLRLAAALRAAQAERDDALTLAAEYLTTLNNQQGREAMTLRIPDEMGTGTRLSVTADGSGDMLVVMESADFRTRLSVEVTRSPLRRPQVLDALRRLAEAIEVEGLR